MAEGRIDSAILTNIANKIRSKLGVSTHYLPSEMPAAIELISGGGSAVVQPLSVAQNGTYNPPSGVDGFAPVTVNVSGGGGDDFAHSEPLSFFNISLNDIIIETSVEEVTT